MKKIFTLIFGLVMLAMISLTLFVILRKPTAPIVQDKPGDISTFSGTLDNYISDCAFDAQCKAIVAGKTILTVPGMVANPGTWGTSQVNADHIGKKVEVKAVMQENGEYTLEGSKDYYVKLVE